MLKFKNLFIGILLSCGAMFMNDAYAYDHEVWKSGSTYYWRINGSQAGSSSSLSTAINSCMGSNRDVHVLTGGSLNGTLFVPGTNVKLYCHGNTFTRDFSGWGIKNVHNGFQVHDMILRGGTNGYGIRSDGGSYIKIINVQIYDCPWIGIRVDSKENNPWEAWVYDLEIQNTTVDGAGDHGIETYSIDGVVMDNIVVRDCSGCGLLFNLTKNGTIGSVDAYNCNWGGGYAGLRYANACNNITTNYLKADHCGRGFFIVQSGPSVNCHLNNAEIYECSGLGIWIENGTNCSVKAGCSESPVSVSGSGSYANVSSNCSGSSSSSSSSGGTYYRLQNRGTGLYLDGMGRTNNGADVGQWANTTSTNAQWTMEAAGSYYKLKNRASGLYLDGMGRTSNGSTVGVWSNGSSYNQQWERISTSGYYRFRNRATGLYLDGMGRTGNGEACGQWANTSHVNSQWSLTSISSAAPEEGMQMTESAFSIYPNPSNGGTFTLDLSEMDAGKAIQVELYSTDGKQVFTKEYAEAGKINLDLSLNKGMYFVMVKNGNQQSTKKLVVK